MFGSVRRFLHALPTRCMSSVASSPREVVIVGAARTPIGSFAGALSSVSAAQLGAIAIQGALAKAKVDPSLVQEVYMGNVLSANLGQAPARQAARGAKLPDSAHCTTINKVCASGSKAVMLAAQSILLGLSDVSVAGGMESMSNCPYYLPQARGGMRLGHGQVVDGLIKDGLWDPYDDSHMGIAAELCAKELQITRDEQDAHAIEAHRRTAAAVKDGFFADEIVPVPVGSKDKATLVSLDDLKPSDEAKIRKLRPAFQPNGGTVTAGNASTLSDGAAAIVLMSAAKAKELGVTPLFRLLSFADFEQHPSWFTTSPSKSLPIALERARLSSAQIDAFEINQAFSVVSVANQRLLKLDPARVDVWGGAVSIGHPIGCSGARILVTLCSVLKQRGGRFGATAICNGGGGASSLVIERL
eukprot:gnl/Spiro4/8729_TR4574_c0_g1_i1.p1 gnl/Spiro4/8729_TR4574_c0_g1~~gnl/Spiro4/8729_TR4574_c0_g1_i1.p1  ORF type:complete len:415 (+),score=80.10 gnl/Spiro4/8729_TR4574_c0_g1_i1:65-1309(+)